MKSCVIMTKSKWEDYKMSEKIKIKSYLKVTGDSSCTLENHYTGKKEENKILYKEGEIMVCIAFLEDKIVMSRKTEEYDIELPFVLGKSLEGKYDIAELGGSLPLKVRTSLLKKQDKELEITYHLTIGKEDIGKYEFRLLYEVIK